MVTIRYINYAGVPVVNEVSLDTITSCLEDIHYANKDSKIIGYLENIDKLALSSTNIPYIAELSIDELLNHDIIYVFNDDESVPIDDVMHDIELVSGVSAILVTVSI